MSTSDTTTDHFYTMGSSHQVCQDYARSGRGAVAAAAVVADGCSSSPDTDVGARILALQAMPWIELGDPMGRMDTIIHLFEGALRLIPDLVLKGCLDTTLLTAQLDGGLFKVVVWGDGFFAARRNDGVIELYRISFIREDGSLSGYPVYPSYFALNRATIHIDPIPGRLEQVLAYSPIRLIERWTLGHHAMVVEDYSSLRQVVEEQPSYIWEMPVGDCDLVALMSDGADSFYKTVRDGTSKRNEEVDVTLIAKLFMAFKGMRGSFVQRRARRALRDLAAEGITPSDDFSMAAIHIDHGEEP